MSFWQTKNLLAYLLLPLSFLYRAVVVLRKWLYQTKIKKTTAFPVPVIVVGNITVGGTGKTPLVIWLANFLKQQGYYPGIVSRGYGAKALQYPMMVLPNSDPSLVGDEPLLIVRNTQCPMVVDPQRVRAVKKVLQDAQCDIVISDDGLQHYALGRAIEIVVVDGTRKFGNKFCLPAGPLREPLARLQEVDLVVTNGVEQQLIPNGLCRVNKPAIKQSIDYFKDKIIHAIAGIGYPPRFFNLLRELGLTIIEHSFPDHYQFQAADLRFADDAIVIMTEKDAVKCEKFANDAVWYLPVQAQLSAEFIKKFLQILRR